MIFYMDKNFITYKSYYYILTKIQLKYFLNNYIFALSGALVIVAYVEKLNKLNLLENCC